jgi:thiamine biosynthesis lipoprotein
MRKSGLRRVEMIMGTAITIDARSADLPESMLGAHIEAAFAWFREVDARFSTYKPDSEVSRLRSGQLRIDAASTDTRQILDRCEELRAATNGYFDAYAGGVLDPSGLVKGWSVQEASDRLRAAGIDDHFVNAGGDIRVRGTGPDDQPWRIGIAHPWERPKLAWVVEATDLAIATSGTYERGLHVLDPFTGTPVDALASVTVTGSDLGIADAYATAAMAMGLRGLDWLAALDGYESAAITRDRQAYRSSGFPSVTPMPIPDSDMRPY